MNTVTKAPLHNPAASYDFGTFLWGVDEYVKDADQYRFEGIVAYNDEATMQYAWDRTNKAWNDHIDAEIEAHLEVQS